MTLGRLLTVIFSLLSFSFALPTLLPRAASCNGHPELCGRGYGAVTYLTSHNSYGVSNDPLVLTRNQQISLNDQMNMGVRALQAQSHMKDGVLHFCHTDCRLFDGGPVIDYLRTVKAFMDAHPAEVFTFIFTNPEGLSPKDVWDPLFQQSGLAGIAFIPPHLPMKAAEWPTLGSMVDSGRRLVVFMDSNSNTDDVPYILPQFDHVWETPFDPTDASFPCKVDRISGPVSPAEHMYLVNHNLNYPIFPSRKRSPSWWDDVLHGISNAITGGIDKIKQFLNQSKGTISSIMVPDLLKLPTTNSVDSIVADSNGCKAQTSISGGKAANFVLLDFVDVGQTLRAVDVLNGFA